MRNENHKSLSEDEVQKLPTILNILDGIAQNEEKFRTDKRYGIFSNFGFEDKFEIVPQFQKTSFFLEPTKASFNTYYRGQIMDYQQCLPTLFRKPGNNPINRFIKILKQAEFELLIKGHPFYQIFEHGITLEKIDRINPIKFNIDALGLAQHYGLETNLLDFSSDKWVAAFFAVCENINGDYFPKKSEGYGAFYLYNDFSWLSEPVDKHRVFKPIGLQPFSRPAGQRAYSLEMKEGEDLNKYPGVVKYLFRHDHLAGEIIYNRMNQGKILFPDDSLVELTSKIKQSFEFSSKALSLALKRWDRIDKDRITTELLENGYKIRNYQLFKFPKEEIKAFNRKWKNQGKKVFIDKIVFRPTYQ